MFSHSPILLSSVSLTKSYPMRAARVSVLRDLELTVHEGEMIAIVGASGVGKSTLLHVLGGLDSIDSGEVRIKDTALTTLPDDERVAFRNRHVGFVFQFHHLLPEFTALENVMMPALIQRIAVPKARTMAADILGRVGLRHRLTHRPNELSGGEQQRVALARAMVLEPALLLADEPTGNLDRTTGESIHQLFLELNKERGSTLLVVTHNPELARLMPRRLRMVDGGRLVEDGLPTLPDAPLEAKTETDPTDSDATGDAPSESADNVAAPSEPSSGALP